MEIVSNDFRPTIYSGEANHIADLTIGGVTIANENIKSIKLSNPIIDKTNDTFYIGTFVSKQLEIEFWNVDEIDLTGQIHLSIGTYIESLEDYEMVNIGYFNIETSPEDYYKNARIVALDNGVKFKPNVDYSGALDDDGLITCENLLIWLCNHFEVQLGTYPTINKDIAISTYDTSVSGKQYISYIAEIMGGNAQIGRNGELNIIPLKQTPSVQIDATQGKSWELKEKYEITGVTYFDAIRDIPFNVGDDTGNTLYIRTDNPFVVGSNVESETIIENIYNALVGTIIYNLKCENYADYSLDCWDFIEYVLDENTYTTINNNEYTYEMTIMGKVEVDIPSKQVEKTTNTIEKNEKVRFNILKTEIDQQANEIRIVTGQTTDLQSQVNTLTASQEGLTNNLIKAGGNNLIRNSALFFKDARQNADTNLFDYINNYRSNHGGIKSQIGLNDVLISTGTPTVAYVHITENIDITDILEDGEKYTISQFVASDKLSIEVRMTKVSDGTYAYVNCRNSTLRTNSFVVDKNTYSKYEVYVITSNDLSTPVDISNIYWLEKGDGTLIDYENYEVISGYEYWVGKLLRGNDDEYEVNSESSSVILTQVGGASQSISVVPDTYTLSFKYKKISLTSDLTFQVNKKDLTFENQDDGEIVYTFKNDNNNITIDFSSTKNNGYIIYDLMLNKGDTALDYSQNANETMTDTVKIGKGIAVASSNTDTLTRIDSDGFRVLNKNNENDVLLRATDTGTDTKTLKVREWAEISGLRFQRTDEQTWITGII